MLRGAGICRRRYGIELSPCNPPARECKFTTKLRPIIDNISNLDKLTEQWRAIRPKAAAPNDNSERRRNLITNKIRRGAARYHIIAALHRPERSTRLETYVPTLTYAQVYLFTKGSATRSAELGALRTSDTSTTIAVWRSMTPSGSTRGLHSRSPPLCGARCGLFLSPSTPHRPVISKLPLGHPNLADALDLCLQLLLLSSHYPDIFANFRVVQSHHSASRKISIILPSPFACGRAFPGALATHAISL